MFFDLERKKLLNIVSVPKRVSKKRPNLKWHQ